MAEKQSPTIEKSIFQSIRFNYLTGDEKKPSLRTEAKIVRWREAISKVDEAMKLEF
ncbi:MAG: hypothetical protein WAU36_19500 [Cyclobacteriaceae bacterium]